jgi:hypothetical protein
MQGSCQLGKSRYHSEKIEINIFTLAFSDDLPNGFGKIHQKVAETWWVFGGLWLCPGRGIGRTEIILIKCAWHTQSCSCKMTHF